MKRTRGKFVLDLSRKIIKKLKPFCKNIKIAGSIRRKEKNPGDIDIVLIPKNNKNKEKIENTMKKIGNKLFGGEKKAAFKINNIQVELYYTDEKEWGAALLAYSSEKGAGIGLRKFAKLKGFKLNQHGLFKNNKKIAGKSEKEIYNALGKAWKPAEER